jgi:VIT1/CCC1 family predicted Fe2+/Mn2+ transporter
MAKTRHWERHRTLRIGWLRAAVLGANDGIVSTASLLLGVEAAAASQGSVLIAGLAGLVAGAMSMAAGEYVSVHSQADTEAAELETDNESEHNELTAIYIGRGLDAHLARQVADQLMKHDALGAHARDELGITPAQRARPIQAALASAASFAAGAALPLAVAAFGGETHGIALIAGVSLVSLAVLGGVAARAGGARITTGALRVTFWGALAMAITAAVGHFVGTAV